ncbi:EAL domain-containing protein [uncultured Pseudomonas sp.]|uniref:EAL domain-containing protein n=1 Tax=uncultured Pseudomonas sp. TaxID=114707 RepID=UPI0025FF9ADF|nr:EAL domain-containing protein [uncultured Pseudomonas sp.]MCW1938381.1 EAL domain-containing protein [Pseudomonas sp. MDMC_285]
MEAAPRMKPLSLHHLVNLLLCLCLLGCAWSTAAEARTVRVGVYANEPKIFADVNAQPSGILGELLQAIANEERWQLQTVPCAWQQCLQLLQDGEIDLLPDVAFSEERAQLMDFHQVPSLFSWSQLYSHEELRLQSVLDLRGLRIAALEGSIQFQYLQSLLGSFGLQAQMIPLSDLSQGFAMVLAEQADAVVANQLFGDYHAANYRLIATPIMFQPAQLFYATRKGANGELLSAIDQHLQNWQSAPGSIYFQVLQRWSGAPQQRSVPVLFWWGLALLAALLTLAIGGSLLLRRQVADKTRHLKTSEARLNTILDSVEAHIYIKDPQLRYQYVNRKVCELFGRSAEQVIGHSDADFFDSDTAQALGINDRRVLAGERIESEETNRDRYGRNERTYFSVKLPLRAADGSIYALCGISTDITEHKKNLEQIHQLAYYDALTGLPNRRLLLEHLQFALARSARSRREGALLFIDLDNFKQLNDTLGHDMGDLLLQHVSERLLNQVRLEDSLARLGGDEFVLILENLEPEPQAAIATIEHVAEKLLRALATPFELPGYNHSGSASIGVALFSQPHDKPEELLKHADLAMYEAKAAGRNTLCFFDPRMQQALAARATLEHELRRALSEAQLLLHYQPQVDERGELLGAEALVRWQHPQRGLVPPGEFIPLAESTGLILPMGRWILHTACQQLASWANDPQRAELTVAINVSARQFHHPDFVTDVLSALQKTGANPHKLELELTESQLVQDIEALINKMGQLRAYGVRFSLDDFGTGYSSLSYLKRLPLDQLKIDRSFVRDLLDNASDTAIVRTILALGQALELRVIAEGVESQAQRDALLSLGCRHFQGYLYGVPQPAEQIGVYGRATLDLQQGSA